jgi:SAM-dependent methyltransferase
MSNGSFSTGIKVTFGSPPPSVDTAAKPRIPFEACPLCGARDLRTLRTGDCTPHPLYKPVLARTMTWLQCGDCTHVFTDGYFSPELATIVFGQTQESQQPGWGFEEQRYASARIVEHVANFVDSGAWLDVGFGNGSLLLTAEEWGFTPVGLDLRRSSVEAMQRLGIVEVHCRDIADFDWADAFSVISMADVLEHMPFPKVGLESVRRLLRPDGILFLSMPNYNCAAWRLLDATGVNPYWGEFEHFHNFSRARLYSLLKEMGFEPVRYRVSERYRLCMEVLARRAG